METTDDTGERGGKMILSPHALRQARGPTPAPFRVVVVCTGNRFRSPLAADLLRRAAGEAPVDVRSTGTMDLGPVPALPEAVTAAADLDIDLRKHLATPLTQDVVAGADLVLGFERSHVAACVIDLRVARERVFTMPELASLLRRLPPPSGEDPVERARAAVAAAHALRMSDPWTSELAEIRDPLGQTPRVRAEIVQELQAAAAEVGELLFAEAGGAAARRAVG